MAPTFEDYLYKKHRAVFVDTMSETAVDLALLDVLVKNGSESEGWFSSSHPVLVRCGSLGEVGTYTKPDDQRRLQDGLDLFDKCTREKIGVVRALWHLCLSLRKNYVHVEESWGCGTALLRN